MVRIFGALRARWGSHRHDRADWHMVWAGVGGLFLAFPAMLCASATLVDSHERRRKNDAGLEGQQRGRDAAALDAAGAALGSIALVAFAATVLLTVDQPALSSLALASLVWVTTACCCWWVFKRRHKLRMRMGKLRS